MMYQIILFNRTSVASEAQEDNNNEEKIPVDKMTTLGPGLQLPTTSYKAYVSVFHKA